MPPKKRKAVVDRALCVSCGACVKVCPRQALSIYKGLYSLVDESKCIGCKKCAKECPASVIEIVTLEAPIDSGTPASTEEVPA